MESSFFLVNTERSSPGALGGRPLRLERPALDLGRDGPADGVPGLRRADERPHARVALHLPGPAAGAAVEPQDLHPLAALRVRSAAPQGPADRFAITKPRLAIHRVLSTFLLFFFCLLIVFYWLQRSLPWFDFVGVQSNRLLCPVFISFT